MLLQDCQIAGVGTLKQKTHLQAHLCRCQKCSNGFFGKSWPSVVFPNEVLNYSFSSVQRKTFHLHSTLLSKQQILKSKCRALLRINTTFLSYFFEIRLGMSQAWSQGILSPPYSKVKCNSIKCPSCTIRQVSEEKGFCSSIQWILGSIFRAYDIKEW